MAKNDGINELLIIRQYSKSIDQLLSVISAIQANVGELQSSAAADEANIIALQASAANDEANILALQSAQTSTNNALAALQSSTNNALAALQSLVVLPGTIFKYGGILPPTGYLLCDGTSLVIASNLNLYNAIGLKYTTPGGDLTRFNLPTTPPSLKLNAYCTINIHDLSIVTGVTDRLNVASVVVIADVGGYPTYPMISITSHVTYRVTFTTPMKTSNYTYHIQSYSAVDPVLDNSIVYGAIAQSATDFVFCAREIVQVGQDIRLKIQFFDQELDTEIIKT